ncbi:MAG TPA: winged helix-turn-helix domain-containing protein [Burkholderiaceae bacterium]|nr:winged helix-turn-helix domain-containing protein [Burkholderiaceae bacterium]
MDEISAPDYEFGGFRLDTRQQRLLGPGGASVDLPSRAFSTLHYLVERSGQVVGKSELMSAVWPHTVVAENNLNQSIAQLRKVLGESAGDRRFILTVPGRGYKFVMPVTVVPREAMAELGAAGTAAVTSATARRAGRPWLAYGAALALALVLAVVFWTQWPRRAVTSAAEYQPLTDVADSATAPVLSPDGRKLAFIRNGSWLLGPGQVWVKDLPDGDYLRLTNASGLLFAPAFTPDGSHVTYTVVDKRGESWDTWSVPVTGGEPTRLLSNASGLTYIGPHEVLFSRFRTGIHLGLVTSTDTGANSRDVYWPDHERAMAHFSYLSPDRRWVLVVEMNGTGNFQQCRLVPFAGGSGGHPVGPARGACIAAAWAPDGQWMYFVIGHAAHSHVWRQRFPDGEPQQITFGPTDEEGVVLAADGRSLLTSIGSEQDTLWLHDARGEQALTTEGGAFYPWLSADSRRVYFMSANAANEVVLARLDLGSGKRETLLRDFNVDGFDVDAGERHVVFTRIRDGVPQVWLAPLDGRTPPLLLVRNGDQARFGGNQVFYRSPGKQVDYLHRIDLDGTHDTRVVASPIVNFDGASPDGRDVIVDMPVDGGLAAATLVSLDDHAGHVIGKGWYQSRWSSDGRYLLVEIGRENDPTTAGRTAAVRVGAGSRPREPVLPLPADTVVIPRAEDSLAVGNDPSVYVYTKADLRRNIYRVPLH